MVGRIISQPSEKIFAFAVLFFEDALETILLHRQVRNRADCDQKKRFRLDLIADDEFLFVSKSFSEQRAEIDGNLNSTLRANDLIRA